MTLAETHSWNAAIEAMRDTANRSADLIEATGRRPLVEAFAVVALRQLAEDGAALLLRRKPGDAANTASVRPVSPAPIGNAGAHVAAE